MSLKGRIDNIAARLLDTPAHEVIAILVHLPQGASGPAPPNMHNVTDGIWVWFVHVGAPSLEAQQRRERVELRRLRGKYAASAAPAALPKGSGGTVALARGEASVFSREPMGEPPQT